MENRLPGTLSKLRKCSDMTAVGSSAASAVGRLFGFQSDGPGVRRHDGSPSMDPAGVNTFVELVGDDAKVPVLHDDVARDGGQDLLAIFIPAGEESVVRWSDSPQTEFCLKHWNETLSKPILWERLVDFLLNAGLYNGPMKSFVSDDVTSWTKHSSEPV